MTISNPPATVNQQNAAGPKQSDRVPVRVATTQEAQPRDRSLAVTRKLDVAEHAGIPSSLAGPARDDTAVNGLKVDMDLPKIIAKVSPYGLRFFEGPDPSGERWWAALALLIDVGRQTEEAA